MSDLWRPADCESAPCEVLLCSRGGFGIGAKPVPGIRRLDRRSRNRATRDRSMRRVGLPALAPRVSLHGDDDRLPQTIRQSTRALEVGRSALRRHRSGRGGEGERLHRASSRPLVVTEPVSRQQCSTPTSRSRPSCFDNGSIFDHFNPNPLIQVPAAALP